MATEKRLISLDEALEATHKEVFWTESEAAAIRSFLVKLPKADAVEVVHGQWVGIQYDGYADGCPVYDLWECSNCREEYESEGDPPPYNYCPNCGAKMDGGADNGI